MSLALSLKVTNPLQNQSYAFSVINLFELQLYCLRIILINSLSIHFFWLSLLLNFRCLCWVLSSCAGGSKSFEMWRNCSPLCSSCFRCFREQVPEETIPHLLLGAQNQRLGPRPARSTISFLLAHRNHFWQFTSVGKSHGSGISRATTTSPKTILQSTLDSVRCRGLPRVWWMDNVKEWTSLSVPEPLTTASRRKDWKRISAEWSLVSPHSNSHPPPRPRRPNRSKNRTELN